MVSYFTSRNVEVYYITTYLPRYVASPRRDKILQMSSRDSTLPALAEITVSRCYHEIELFRRSEQVDFPCFLSSRSSKFSYAWQWYANSFLILPKHNELRTNELKGQLIPCPNIGNCNAYGTGKFKKSTRNSRLVWWRLLFQLIPTNNKWWDHSEQCCSTKASI